MERGKRKRSAKRKASSEARLEEDNKPIIVFKRKKKLMLEEIYAALTQEEENDVEKLINGQSEKIPVVHEDIIIDKECAERLNVGNWINDNIIGLYCKLLKERQTRTPHKFKKCHFASSFYYTKIRSNQSVCRWETTDILKNRLAEFHKIFFPIHHGKHWSLIVIDVEHQAIQYCDSLGGRSRFALRYMHEYMKKLVTDASTWTVEIVDVPQQDNYNDCGVFLLMNIDFLSRGIQPSFNCREIPYFRRRIAKAILASKAD